MSLSSEGIITEDVQEYLDKKNAPSTKEAMMAAATLEAYDRASFPLKTLDMESLKEAVSDKYIIRQDGIFAFKIDKKKDPITRQTVEIVYQVLVSYTTVLINAIGRDIDKGENYIQVYWIDRNGRKNLEWISYKTALTKPGIIELMSKGVNIPEPQARDMTKYFAYMISKIPDHTEEQIITQKNGWKDDFRMFVFGDIGFTDKGEVRVLTLQKANGSNRSGELDEWKKAVEPLIKIPLVRIKSYIALAAPLLRILNIQSFVFDNYFESTAAKTTSTDIAMSLFGNPKDLQHSANSTRVGAERVAESFTDLPINLDETSSMKTEVLQEMVYTWAGERGKNRGTKDGKLQETGSWKTVVMTTGEKAITSDQSFTGAQVRVLEYYGGITEHIPREIERAKKGIEYNHGHIFPLYIKELLNVDQVRKEYTNIRASFCDSNNGIDSRLKDTFSAIATAGKYLEDIFEMIGLERVDHIELTRSVYSKITEDNKIQNYSERGLEVVASFIESKRKFFIDERWEESELKDYADLYHFDIYGWIVPTTDNKKDEFVDVIPSLLKKHLEASGIDYNRCLHDWREVGIIITQGGRFTTMERHADGMKRVIRFKAEYLTMPEDQCFDNLVNYLTKEYKNINEPTTKDELTRLRLSMQTNLIAQVGVVDNSEMKAIDHYLFQTRGFKILL